MAFSVIKDRKKVNYVIIDTYSTFSFWYVLLVSQLCLMFQLRYIPILHGGNLPHRLDKNPKLAQLIFNHSYHNVAPSGYLLEAFRKRNFPNLVFIPNTIDLSNYPYLKQRDTHVPKLLWVRSFATLYHPKMAIDVLKKVQEQYLTAQLCMVGPDKDGSLEEARSYAQQEKIQVKFTGRLSKAEWVALSKNYNTFINTTNFDNTPVSVIEAMCLGLPVVTTNVGGIPFLLENRKTALLVEAKAVKEMAEAVIELTKNHELRTTLVQNGREYVEHFDWQAVKHQWAKLLTP